MLNRFMIKLIKLYQRMPLSSHSQCKFIPTCSNYALEAYQVYPFFKATKLMVKRLLRCNPFNKGGIDLLEREEKL